MTEAPVLKLPDKPNFMVIDGKTFFVKEVAQSPESILKHIEEYYNANMEDLKERVASHVSIENDEDLGRQVARIERHLTKGIVALPDNARTNGSIIMVHNNKAYETRTLLFRPTRISVTLRRVVDWVHWVETQISKKDAERFTKFLEWAKPLIVHYNSLVRDLSNIKIDITVEQDMIIEAMVASHIRDSKAIYVFPVGVHCHVHSHGLLCTGNASAEMFWDDPQFFQNFNSLNPHSFAFGDCKAARDHKLLLKNAYFIEGRVRETEGAWRV